MLFVCLIFGEDCYLWKIFPPGFFNPQTYVLNTLNNIYPLYPEEGNKRVDIDTSLN